MKKPDCIGKWFSVNVGYEHEDLIPIPIGIASNFSKNLNVADFEFFEKTKFQEKELSLYINFQTNKPNERKIFTNFFQIKNGHLLISQILISKNI